MSDEPRPDRDEIRRATGQEARDLVEDILKQQADRAERERDAELRPRRKRSRWQVPAVIVLLQSQVLWFVRPSWMEPPPLDPPPAELDAGLRMELFVAVQKLETYARSQGRLPSSLAEADSPRGTRIEYVPQGDSYTLRAFIGDTVLTFDRGDNPRALLGNAMNVIRGNG